MNRCPLLLFVLTLGVLALTASGPGAGAAVAQDQSGSAAAPEVGPQHAQFGAGLSYKYTHAEFGKSYDPGWGLQALYNYPLIAALDLNANIGWNHFSGSSDSPSVNIWEFVGGIRFKLGAFFMSGDVGYYTEINSTSFQPGLGLKFDHWEVAWSVRSVPSGSWNGLRLGYYF